MATFQPLSASVATRSCAVCQFPQARLCKRRTEFPAAFLWQQTLHDCSGALAWGTMDGGDTADFGAVVQSLDAGVCLRRRYARNASPSLTARHVLHSQTTLRTWA